MGLVSGRKKLFKPLKISEYPDLILDYQGQFPVISITFKSVEGASYYNIEQGVKSQIWKLFQAYSYLNNSNKLEQSEKANFNRYLFDEITLEQIKQSLSILSKLLYKYEISFQKRNRRSRNSC
ncbi:MAG: hypothetical protein QMO91_06105 [Candidatus Tisiphia sp.]|nr:hypothetical protein [Candidatus Tisiphia sp.]